MNAEAKTGIVIPAVLTAVAFVILVGLGSWQLQRLHWKEELMARVAQRIEEPPAPLPPRSEWADLDYARWEYRPVTLHGRFDHGREARVYTLLSEPKGREQGAGYFILTPLSLADGSGTVIVNRGFVPQERAGPETRSEGQTEGDVTVTGLLRAPEAGNMFTPAPDPQRKLFFSRDAADIAAGYGITDAAPFTVDADATSNPGGLPQGGETRIAFPNRHLEYALTWYGLAAGLLGVFGAWAWSRRRRS
ncbi:SURF1-like protein [Agaricicola taiwanensis]|uniref:SURF1-like protein n=1 Tax=Agaricicola taiwanensis TaxID=591372 RepID=A0A8J2YBV7_9RHOB|nr:SURF1 family protein [Agaricicola taiwanensis]GGE34675.1 SURF1-like protein [Agaricicola taiwanensis]